MVGFQVVLFSFKSFQTVGFEIKVKQIGDEGEGQKRQRH